MAKCVGLVAKGLIDGFSMGFALAIGGVRLRFGFTVQALPKLSEGGQGRLTFRCLFAFAHAAGQFDSIMVHRALKDPVVVRAGGGDDEVLRSVGGHGLEQLLQLAFGVFQDGKFRQSAEGRLESAQEKGLCRFKTAIEKNRPNESFKRIRQGGCSFASAVHLLAATDSKVPAEVQFTPMFGQGATIDQFGSSLGEWTFFVGRKSLEQLPGQRELEDGVAKKFQALIGGRRNAGLVTDGGMGQSQLKKRYIAKRIAKLALKFVEIQHGKQTFQ